MSRFDPHGIEAYSRELWQRHEIRRQRPSHRELWPDRAYFKAAWTPASAVALIVADWKIDGARTNSPVTEIALEVLDPPPVEHVDWRITYADELHGAPRLAWPLAQANPIGALLRRFTRPTDEVRPGQARLLSPLESRSLELWVAGYSFGAIAEATGAPKQSCVGRVKRAVAKLRLVGLEALAS